MTLKNSEYAKINHEASELICLDLMSSQNRFDENANEKKNLAKKIYWEVIFRQTLSAKRPESIKLQKVNFTKQFFSNGHI